MTLPNGITPVKFRLQGELLQQRQRDADGGLKLHVFTNGNERRVGFTWPNGNGLWMINPTGDQVQALWQFMKDNPEKTGNVVPTNASKNFLAFCRATYSPQPGGA